MSYSSGEEESFEELQPQISSSKAPSLPAALFKMKRKPNQVLPNNKRSRVYQDAQGNPVFVDAEIFKIIEQGQRQNPNIVGLDSDDEEAVDDESHTNPFDEDYAQEERQQQVRFQRGMKAARIAAEGTKTAPSARKLRRIMQSQNLTNDELLYGLENDEEGLRWVPALNPETSLEHSLMKSHNPLDSCYGCERGVGVARVTQEKLVELHKLIIDLFPTTHITHLCVLISEWFEENIKNEFNRRPAKHLAPLQSWTPSSIYEHLTYHMTEASFIHNRLLRDIYQHYRVVLYREVYRVPAELVQPGSKVGLTDLRVAKRGHDMLMQSAKMVLEILSKKPETMSHYNEHFNVAQEYTAPVNRKANAKTAAKTTSIFDEIETQT